MRIAALTCRSFYSLLRASVSVQRWVDKAAEHGYGAVALADVNSLAGVVDLYKAAQSVDVQPIVGVEILTESQRAILLAENRAGYENLCRIVSACNLQTDFNLVAQLQRDNRGVLCLCNQSALLKRLRTLLEKECLFAGCSSPRDVAFAAAHDVEPVAWNNATWLDHADVAITKTLAQIRTLSVTGPGPDDSYGVGTLPSIGQIKQRFADGPRALANADKIVERCNFRLLTGQPILPQAKLAHGTTSARELAKLCHRGLAQRYQPVTREIVKRLEYELATVEKNGFCDYFLVVYEIVRFAKQQRIPVEVRGSAAGALISHVLGFTRVCPIENKLYFERFMNPGRTDCPDIDIDLCWRRRDDVIRFCYEHWGFEHVAMVCNINRYRRRGAIRDAGRALGLMPVEINQLSRAGKIKRTSPVYRLAEQLVGIPRHLGVHCGGIVVTPGPVSHVAPLERANKGVIITQYDKDAAEAVGLVKIDLLGNRSLSTVNEAIQILSAGRHGDGDVSFEPSDRRTAKMLSEGDSLGVFQSESPGMRQLLRGLKVKNKKDLAIALSLIRPGPASGGMKAAFIERHVQGKPFEYLHPKLADLLGDTYGVMLYQEDVMRIAVEIAGYTVADADRFRSEVSKKVSASRLQAQYIDFVRSRAEQAGIDRQTAETIWEEILRFAAYSYCKAHATVYANIAWQTAYLKAHYPTEFYCSLLNNHHGMYPLRVYVWDAKRHGIKVLPPHVNYSEIEWSVQGRAIRAGLNVLKGLSHTTAENVVRQRQVRLFRDIDDLQRRLTFRKPELRNLIHVGACDGLGATRPLMLNRLHFTRRDPDQLLLFDVYRDCAIRRLPDYDRIARLKAELDTAGISFGLHPATLLSGRYLPAIKLAHVQKATALLGRKATVAGFVAAARKARTSDGRVMGFITLEDATGLAEVSFFPDQIKLYQSICSYGGPVWVSGKVTEHLSSIAVECIECGKVA